jgi:adenine phosphoribosyltransferase
VLELQTDSFSPGTRVLVVDDLLATGGTAAAAISLVEQLGGTVVGPSFLIELAALGGAELLGGRAYSALIRY